MHRHRHGEVAELSMALVVGFTLSLRSSLPLGGFNSCASLELEKWREFILKAKYGVCTIV